MSYIWETRKIEDITMKKLFHDLGDKDGSDIFGKYTEARKHILTDILPEIHRIWPGGTDHGPDHVRDVLDCAEYLLGNDIDKLSCIELYCLILSILFHDVGNIFNRDEHQRLIDPIYNYVRPIQKGCQAKEEKHIILKICEAHCGESFERSRDTLHSVPDRVKLYKKEVRPQQIASILRFADELAEGEHRTSLFMLINYDYPIDSMIYHWYSAFTLVDIDRKGSRIRLTYHVNIKRSGEINDSNGSMINIDYLDDFLSFVYRRIEKLNQERQYAKHYCNLLDSFKKTTVTINFHYNNYEIPIDLQQVELSDLIVPGDSHKEFCDYDNNYKPDYLVPKITRAIDDIKRQFK